MILGDESQLKQVIINLMANAFDATADGTTDIHWPSRMTGRAGHRGYRLRHPGGV
jgi:C4-dicarboxylate-specific signal transduction histidine kinase